MQRLFQKTDPKTIKKGFFSTWRKSRADLSVSDLFSKCELSEWLSLKNKLDEKLQTSKSLKRCQVTT
jgi:hypothetical protein